MRKQYEITFSHFLHSRPMSLKAMFVLSILLTVLAGMFLKSEVVYAVSSAPTITCKQWNYVSSPSPGTGDSLVGVAAVSSTDVWAVGSTYNGSITLTLAEHYDGTQWTVISTPTPPPGAVGASFSGVAAISTNDVWAVGSYWYPNYGTYTLIEQWNGTSWNVVPSPTPGSGQDAFLNSVAAVSATDIWAVGVSDAGTVIEQWNGSSWNVVPSPNPGISPYFTSVTAVSLTDAWAVGYYYNSNGYLQTLIENWNGTSWNVVASPSGSGLYNTLTGVAAVSSTNVWAVGAQSPSNASRFSPQSGGGGPSQTLIEHWNGTSWSIVPSPNPTSVSGLSGIATISKKNIWAVGSFDKGQGNYHSLIEHWNGKQWKVVLGAKSSQAILNAVASIHGTSSLWAVGGGNNSTFTEYYC